MNAAASKQIAASQAAPLRRRERAAALGLAALGLAGGAAATAAAPEQTLRSWLVAELFWLSVGLGALFHLLLQETLGSRWFAGFRSAARRLALASLALGAAGFIPILAWTPRLYPWMAGASETAPPFGRAGWAAGSLACLGLWTLLAARRRRDAQETRRGEGAASLILYGLSLTAAATLWLQALSPGWFSTMCGVAFFAAAAWSGSAALHLLGLRDLRSGAAGAPSEAALQDMGKMTLAFTLFYGYIEFAQYLIVWSAHIPREEDWYAARLAAFGSAAAALWIAFHVAIPGLVFLRRAARISTAWMAPTGIIMAAGHWLATRFYAIEAGSARAGWATDAAAILFLGGLIMWAARGKVPGERSDSSTRTTGST